MPIISYPKILQSRPKIIFSFYTTKFSLALQNTNQLTPLTKKHSSEMLLVEDNIISLE